ncbi:MAG: hypothetical protein Q4E61_02995 [Alphaproteobacteria bacterium]|nr:hypothetical protein [Alphaproteobacteria bacterium]
MPELTLLRNDGIVCDRADQDTKSSLIISINGIGNVVDQLNNRTIQRQEVDDWDHNSCRADLTPEANDTWKIQLQRNGVNPSPTYASLTISRSAVSYLTLNMPALPTRWPDDLDWDFIFTPQMSNRNDARRISDKVNPFVATISTSLPILKSAMDANGFTAQSRLITTNVIEQILVPDRGKVDFNDITRRIDSIHRVYVSLCTAIRNFRDKVIPNRKRILNSKTREGLYNSLHFERAYTLSYQ